MLWLFWQPAAGKKAQGGEKGKAEGFGLCVVDFIGQRIARLEAGVEVFGEALDDGDLQGEARILHAIGQDAGFGKELGIAGGQAVDDAEECGEDLSSARASGAMSAVPNASSGR